MKQLLPQISAELFDGSTRFANTTRRRQDKFLGEEFIANVARQHSRQTVPDGMYTIACPVGSAFDLFNLVLLDLAWQADLDDASWSGFIRWVTSHFPDTPNSGGTPGGDIRALWIPMRDLALQYSAPFRFEQNNKRRRGKYTYAKRTQR
jgi:hypothetical protein